MTCENIFLKVVTNLECYSQVVDIAANPIYDYIK